MLALGHHIEELALAVRAQALLEKHAEPLDGIQGTARFLGGKASSELEIDDSYVMLPSFEEMKNDRDAMMREMILLEKEMNAWCGHKLLQDYNGRYVLVEPPQPPMSSAESPTHRTRRSAWSVWPPTMSPPGALEVWSPPLPCTRTPSPSAGPC